MDQVRFYYMRDAHNHPRVTVCLAKSETGFAKGLAICSLKDNPEKRIGRMIALHKAQRALKKQRNSAKVIRQEAWEVLHGANMDTGSWDEDFEFKSWFATAPGDLAVNEFEEKLLESMARQSSRRLAVM